MKNYAVLELSSFSNGAGLYEGNLVGQGSDVDAYSAVGATQALSAGNRYYWEVTPLKGDNSGRLTPYVGVFGKTSGSISASYSQIGIQYGDVIGVTYDVDNLEIEFRVNGEATSPGVSTSNPPVPDAIPYFQFYGSGAPQTRANFGQQPFAYAIDNGDGTVSLPDTSPNRDEKWSEGASADSYKAFDGVLGGSSNHYQAIGTSYKPVTLKDFTVTKSLEIWEYGLPAGNNYTIRINGADYTTTSNGNSGWNLVDVPVGTEVVGGFQAKINVGTDGIAGVRLDGRILIDGPANTSQLWSQQGTITNPSGNDITPGHPAYPIANLYDGNPDLAWGGDNQVTKSQMDISFPFNGVVQMKVMSVDSNGSVTVFGSNGTSQTISGTSLTTGVAETVTFTGLTSPITGIEFIGQQGFYLYEFLLDGIPLVDGADTRPFKTLYQTWSEWVIVTLRTASAEADALKSMLKSHAQTYSAGEDYCEGSVIKAFGQLWIAVNDAPATTFADLPALKSHPNWEQLNISA